MRQTTAGERLRAGRPLTERRAAGLLRDILRPALSLIAGTRVPFRVIVEQPCRPLPGRPMLLAANHFCFADVPRPVRRAAGVPPAG